MLRKRGAIPQHGVQLPCAIRFGFKRAARTVAGAPVGFPPRSASGIAATPASGAGASLRPSSTSVGFHASAMARATSAVTPRAPPLTTINFAGLDGRLCPPRAGPSKPASGATWHSASGCHADFHRPLGEQLRPRHAVANAVFGNRQHPMARQCSVGPFVGRRLHQAGEPGTFSAIALACAGEAKGSVQLGETRHENLDPALLQLRARAL